MHISEVIAVGSELEFYTGGIVGQPRPQERGDLLFIDGGDLRAQLDWIRKPLLRPKVDE